MNNLEQAINNKKERIRLLKTNDRLEHIFLTIINNTKIFQNSENKILGLMIFNLCQDSLTAIRIGNYNLVNHYKKRIENILDKIGENQLTKLGVNAILYPMLSYYDYKTEKFKNAEQNMIITISSLKLLSEVLEEKVFPSLFEQYKNLALIYFKNNEPQKVFTILDYLLNDFKSNEKQNEIFNNFNLIGKGKNTKKLFNNIIDEILLKINLFDKESYKTNFNKVVDLLYFSKLFSEEKQLIEDFLNSKLKFEDSSKIVEANLPPIIEGTFLNSIKYYTKEQKDLINDYFTETYNIAL